MALTGCVYDRYAPENCPSSGKYYMSFTLQSTGNVSSASTKAAPGTFDGETVAEQLVSRVDLYFYDAYGAFLEKKTVSSFAQEVADDKTESVSGKVGDFTVELSYRPYKMLVVLNQTADFTGLSLPAARSLKQEKSTDYCGGSVSVNYKEGGIDKAMDITPFFMNSASYLTASGNEVCETPIPEFYLKETESQALSNPFPVYVERMAAKVTVESAQTQFMVPLVTPQGNVTAKVELLGWGLNALNRFSYYFKKVNPAWSWASWTWNNSAQKRSYWAQDPNYLSAENNPGLVQLSDAATVEPDAPYRYLKPCDITAAFGSSLYCLENTADADALPVSDSDAATLFSRATHVLVKARLSFDLSGGTDDAGYTDSNADIFRYKGVFYTKTSLLAALRTDAGLTVADDNDLELVSAAGQVYCKGYDKGERVALRQISTDTVLPLLDGGEPVRIDGFKKGEFYYKIPVEHINNEAVTGTTYPVGRYGVVRNHRYVITLDSRLDGIGTGIWDDSYDIRPFRKPEEYRVSAYVKVSPWLEFTQKFLFVDPSGMLVSDGQVVRRIEDIGTGSAGNKENDWEGYGWYE